MIDVTFTINGTDYSSLLSTYNVAHEVQVQKMVTALDGTEYTAQFRRPVLTFSLIPLTDAQTADLYEILSGINVEVIYTDPYFDTDKYAIMRVTTNFESVFGLRSVNGNRYYKGNPITLRQRTVL